MNTVLLLAGLFVFLEGTINVLFHSFVKPYNQSPSARSLFQLGRFLRGIIGITITVISLT